MAHHESLIAALPKTELHIHIEGSLEPEMMFDLAGRNGVKLPYASVEETGAAYQFSNLQDFLDLYYQGMSALMTEQDYFDLTYAYLKHCADDNVRHTEIFFDPQGHVSRGVDFKTVFDGVSRGLEAGFDEFGISHEIIMCFLRHLDEDDAERMLDLALNYRDRIVGVGLDSSELGHPPSKFKNVFRRARDAGFKLVAHAGEEGPPEYVWEAIDVLGVDRIDHGNRALEDKELVRRLARDKMPLTVCPLSNQRLCVVPDLKKHPIQRMLDAGLVATLNSDDPAYFGGYMNDNFNALDQALSLGRDEIVGLARNGFVAAFCDEDRKSDLLRDFDRAVATL
ncbi:adenosine deaminase [Thalassospira sp.]|uniref:adenosine deaminase n=1 Tax=Thalassospira sp. TaxID=1912094 RepID=UPI00273664E8|nr:adenosine deaminase [Thalassospira sp.]MDP2698937.1 adenosine deaminase [Thalassospira sp.]